MHRSAATIVALFLASSSAAADIEGTAVAGDDGIDLYWWPKLPAVRGWHQDAAHSRQYAVNALAPDGADFATAAAVIYARALYKPREPEVTSLAALIDNDKQSFLEASPEIVIAESAPLATADGQELRTFTFFPPHAGHWELVAYGEEGDFYILFTLSARSPAAYERAKKDFEWIVSHYKENP